MPPGGNPKPGRPEGGKIAANGADADIQGLRQVVDGRGSILPIGFLEESAQAIAASLNRIFPSMVLRGGDGPAHRGAVRVG